MGYDQVLTRVNEIRAMAHGGPVAAPSAAGSADPSAAAAAFQQQLASQTLAAGTAGVPGMSAGSAGAADPSALSAQCAALQGGGLSAQAAMLAQGTTGGAPVAPAAASTHVHGKTQGLDPELLASLDAVATELGSPIDVISGNRTYAEQAKLYEAYRNGTGNLAAPPGHSNHEHGDAADAYVGGVPLASVEGAREIAARHGLHFPVSGEAWHVERVAS